MHTHASAELGLVAKYLAAAHGRRGEAAELAKAAGAPARVVGVIKAAVGAAGPDDAGWAGDLRGVSSAFQEVLRSRSIFYRMLADTALVRVPLRTRLGAVTVGATAYVAGAGKPVPLSALTLESPELSERKACGIVVVTDEIARSGDGAAQALISRELRNAVAAAVDKEFMSIIGTGVTPATASGATALAALSDLRAMLATVNTTAVGKLYWVMSPDVANRAATLTTTTGSPVFPGLGPVGGELLMLPALVSSEVAAGTLYLVDGSGIAASSEAITLSASNEVSLEMLDSALAQDSIVGTGANLVSMFQTNSTAILAKSWFGAERFRANSVAILNTIAWAS